MWIIYSILLVPILAGNEHGSYVNLNPHTYDKCPPEDLMTLNNCCCYLLDLLEQCIPDDEACACCALQSIDNDCYLLCPSHPSSLYLAVLMEDCKPLNDVNACNLPFRVENPNSKSIKKLLSQKFKQFSDDIDVNELIYVESSADDSDATQNSQLKNSTKLIEIAQVSNITDLELLNATARNISNHSVSPMDSSGSNNYPSSRMLLTISICLAFSCYLITSFN